MLLNSNLGEWQADAEGAAAAEDALDVNGPSVIAKDAVTDRQSHSRPLPDWLRGEKRLEDVRQMFRLDAAAVVLDLNEHPFSRNRSRAHLDDAAWTARLYRVQDDVEEDLVDLSRGTRYQR